MSQGVLIAVLAAVALLGLGLLVVAARRSGQRDERPTLDALATGGVSLLAPSASHASLSPEAESSSDTARRVLRAFATGGASLLFESPTKRPRARGDSNDSDASGGAGVSA